MKRMIVFWLATVLMVFFVSCGEGDKESVAEEQQAVAKVSKKGILPIVDEMIAFSVFTPQISGQVIDYEDNKLTKLMEEKSNMHIEWIFSSEKDAKQKINLLLASNKNLPHVIMGDNLDLRENMVSYGEQGVFLRLNEFMEEHSVYFVKALEAQPYVRALITAPDGAIYNMPMINPSFPNSVANRIFINQKWLDELGLSMPTTTEEFKETLIAFRDRDPNGNGIKDEIPLMGANTGWNTNVEGFMLNSFVQYQKANPYFVEDGKVQAAYDKTGYKKGISYLNALVEEGLIDSSSFTQDLSQLKALFENEGDALIGMVAGGGPNAYANLNGNRYRDYTVLPPLKGPDGVQLSGYNPNSLVSSEFVITSAAENPEAIFKYFDYMYSPEVSIDARNGEKGVDWVDPEEGDISLFGTPALFVPILKWGPPQQSHWAYKHPAYSYFTNHEMRSNDPYELQRYLFESAELYRPYIPNIEAIFPSFMYNSDDSDELSQINSTLTDFIIDYRVKFITGAFDIEADWDQYLEELDKIGYKRVLEIMQARLDVSKQ